MDVRKWRTYQKWSAWEEFLEGCPSNRDVLWRVFAEMDKARAFGSARNASLNKRALACVIKDSANSWKHGQ